MIDDPKYLLTRLLIRRQGKMHPYTNLVLAYSAELGDEGVKKAMKLLSTALPTPKDLMDAEPDVAEAGPSRSNSFFTPSKPVFSTPLSAKAKGKQKQKPWSSIPTGLTEAEEKADPDLAEAIKESIWASKVDRVEIDDDGRAIATPPPERPPSSRSVSGSSDGSATSTSPPRNSVFNEEFSLNPKPPVPVNVFARNETSFTLDEIMSCISADELRKVARARKVPLSMLVNRDAVCSALRGIAKSQSVLGFTPVKGKSISRQSTLPFSPAAKVTSESLLVSQLLPCIGNHAIQLTPAIHALISRVNLIFSRTPPIAGSSSLMLPSILVTSHKRRYPEYGSPARSTIWQDRQELLTWERAVQWEALVADALGDTWQEQRKNPTPGFGIRKEQIGRVEGAKVVKRIWEGVWPIWKLMVEGEGAGAVDAKEEQGGLVGDRFKTGHVLTRIVYKGATALGILHEYDQECMVLRALLGQRRWRRGKRG
jgi:Fanconi-associated nuclease 1